jgi:mevalonate kinase
MEGCHMTAASAPGKIILFGEHAVVSGVSALGGAIDLRARVRLEDTPGKTSIEARDLTLQGFRLDLITGQIVSADAMRATRYVSSVLKEYGARDITVKVDSDLPLAAGLGSSAAIVVATLAALNEHMDLGLSRKDVASQAYKIEKAVQQGLGSPMDTALATYGGYLQVSRDISPLDLPQLDIAVGSTEQPHDTRCEVERVQGLLAQHPDIVGPIFQAIGAISSKAVALLRDMRLEELGELMNVNHGLLEAVGVGTKELSELVYAARGAGEALGAKITGAGGGGCMIALPSSEGSTRLIAALKQAGGRAFLVKTGCEGVRVVRDR